MDADKPQVFFSGRLTYPRLKMVFAGLFTIGIAAMAWTAFVRPTQPRPLSFGLVADVVFAGGIGSTMGIVGVWLLKTFVFGRGLVVEITSDGIRQGGTFHNWDKVGWLRGQRVPGLEGLCLVYSCRGRLRPNRYLQVDTNPTNDEYRQLTDSLRKALRESHPQVTIG